MFAVLYGFGKNCKLAIMRGSAVRLYFVSSYLNSLNDRPEIINLFFAFIVIAS